MEIKNVLFVGIPSKQITGKIDTEFLASFSELPDYNILLCDHPEYYPQLQSYSINLFISSHCHGGQIRICDHGLFAPGQGLLPRYHHGVYDGRLVISSGCANTVSIPRFGNESEVVVMWVGGSQPTQRPTAHKIVFFQVQIPEIPSIMPYHTFIINYAPASS